MSELEKQQHARERARGGGEAHHAGVGLMKEPRSRSEAAAASKPRTPHQRQGDRGSGDDDDENRHRGLPVYVRFADISAAGIAGSWTQILRMIEFEGFPPGLMLSSNIRAWRRAEIEEWLAHRPTARKTMPEGCAPTRGRRRRVTEEESATA